MVVLTQKILNDVTSYLVANHFQYLTVGTGDNPITLETTDLESPVQIGSSDRNKIYDSITQNENAFNIKFSLQAPEPDSQPVNIGEFGIQTGANVDDELEAGFVQLSSTKDNLSKWNIRYSGRVIEDV